MIPHPNPAAPKGTAVDRQGLLYIYEKVGHLSVPTNKHFNEYDYSTGCPQAQL